MKSTLAMVAVYLLLFVSIFMSMSSCSSIQLNSCKSLCSNQKVDFFKDEVIECKCHVVGTNEERD